MNIFKEQRHYIEERIFDLQKGKASFEERIKKIKKLEPEEQVAIYFYDKMTGPQVNPWRENWEWLDSILKFSEDRVINELKSKSIWLADSHKCYMEIARPLVNELGFDLALKVIDIIVTPLTKGIL